MITINNLSIDCLVQLKQKRWFQRKWKVADDWLLSVAFSFIGTERWLILSIRSELNQIWNQYNSSTARSQTADRIELFNQTSICCDVNTESFHDSSTGSAKANCICSIELFKIGISFWNLSSYQIALLNVIFLLCYRVGHWWKAFQVI